MDNLDPVQDQIVRIIQDAETSELPRPSLFEIANRIRQLSFLKLQGDHISNAIIAALRDGTGVVCKFRFSGIKTGSVAQGKDLPDKRLTTIEMWPVYHNGDKTHENYKFWEYSPSGKFELGTVNQAAVNQLELGKEYYIFIAKAPEELNIPK